jgi:hypothetical protein
MIVAIHGNQTDADAVIEYASAHWCERHPKWAIHCPLSNVISLNRFVQHVELDVQKGYRLCSLAVLSGSYNHATVWRLVKRFALLPNSTLVFIRFGDFLMKEMPPIDRTCNDEYEPIEPLEIQPETIVVDQDASEITGLPAGCRKTEKELRSLYKRLVLQWHPDKPGGDQQKFLAIQSVFKRILPANIPAP